MYIPVYGVTHLLNAARVEPVSLSDGVILVWRQVRQLSLGAAALVDAVGYADPVLCGNRHAELVMDSRKSCGTHRTCSLLNTTRIW